LKLFDHKGRKLALTPQGEIFYLEAKKVLSSVEEAKEKIKIIRPISAGKFRWRLRHVCVTFICRALRAFAPLTRP
jgi:DNA-binding transcriptional LysR family regulator